MALPLISTVFDLFLRNLIGRIVTSERGTVNLSQALVWISLSTMGALVAMQMASYGTTALTGPHSFKKALPFTEQYAAHSEGEDHEDNVTPTDEQEYEQTLFRCGEKTKDRIFMLQDTFAECMQKNDDKHRSEEQYKRDYCKQLSESPLNDRDLQLCMALIEGEKGGFASPGGLSTTLLRTGAARFGLSALRTGLISRGAGNVSRPGNGLSQAVTTGVIGFVAAAGGWVHGLFGDRATQRTDVADEIGRGKAFEHACGVEDGTPWQKGFDQRGSFSAHQVARCPGQSGTSILASGGAGLASLGRSRVGADEPSEPQSTAYESEESDQTAQNMTRSSTPGDGDGTSDPVNHLSSGAEDWRGNRGLAAWRRWRSSWRPPPGGTADHEDQIELLNVHRSDGPPDEQRRNDNATTPEQDDDNDDDRPIAARGRTLTGTEWSKVIAYPATNGRSAITYLQAEGMLSTASFLRIGHRDPEHTQALVDALGTAPVDRILRLAQESELSTRSSATLNVGELTQITSAVRALDSPPSRPSPRSSDPLHRHLTVHGRVGRINTISLMDAIDNLPSGARNQLIDQHTRVHLRAVATRVPTSWPTTRAPKDPTYQSTRIEKDGPRHIDIYLTPAQIRAGVPMHVFLSMLVGTR